MREKSNAISVVFIAALLTFAALPTLAIAAPAVAHGGVMWNDSVTSTNWSGYAVTGPAGSVTDVKGSWTVPAIQGKCPTTAQYSSHWVGIDGYSSNTVEQTGTDSDCQGGVPTYYAWYEFYPHPSFLINGLTISPGDKIQAEVKSTGRSFVTIITDQTTGKSFTASSKVKAQASSAEWITEAPSGSGGILPLSDFGTISWGPSNTATISGATHVIGAFSSANIHEITMTTKAGATKASPSALQSDEASFTVTWVSSGP